jgi:hypothetical protein
VCQTYQWTILICTVYFSQMQGGGSECKSTGTGPGAEQCGQTYHWTILICTVYFCQMQGGGGECESTGTGPVLSSVVKHIIGRS